MAEAASGSASESAAVAETPLHVFEGDELMKMILQIDQEEEEAEKQRQKSPQEIALGLDMVEQYNPQDINRASSLPPAAAAASSASTASAASAAAAAAASSASSIGGGSNTSAVWTIFGKEVSRSAAVFTCQILILYISIITCFVNLTIQNGPNELWITFLGLSLGSILPSPKIKKIVGPFGGLLTDESLAQRDGSSIFSTRKHRQ